MLKLSRDRNGNKTLIYSNGTDRGFSVQTLGNLPHCHRATNETIDRKLAMAELRAYINQYGTKRQKELLC